MSLTPAQEFIAAHEQLVRIDKKGNEVFSWRRRKGSDRRAKCRQLMGWAPLTARYEPYPQMGGKWAEQRMRRQA